MFDIYCSSCDAFYLVGTSALSAFRNTDGQALGVARCPHDHEVIVDFSAGRATKPAAQQPAMTPVAA